MATTYYNLIQKLKTFLHADLFTCICGNYRVNECCTSISCIFVANLAKTESWGSSFHKRFFRQRRRTSEIVFRFRQLLSKHWESLAALRLWLNSGLHEWTRTMEDKTIERIIFRTRSSTLWTSNHLYMLAHNMESQIKIYLRWRDHSDHIYVKSNILCLLWMTHPQVVTPKNDLHYCYQ